MVQPSLQENLAAAIDQAALGERPSLIDACEHVVFRGECIGLEHHCSFKAWPLR